MNPGDHPNASAAALAGAIVVLILYAVGFAGVDPPAEVAAALTTVVTTIVLWAGRRRPRRR